MTGEMTQADPTPEEYPLHYAIAEALGGTVRPFDKYQGPYVSIGMDLHVGAAPYAVPIEGFGIIRLWICQDDNGRHATIYNEANSQKSRPFRLWAGEATIAAAINAARSIL